MLQLSSRLSCPDRKFTGNLGWGGEGREGEGRARSRHMTLKVAGGASQRQSQEVLVPALIGGGVRHLVGVFDVFYVDIWVLSREQT